MLNINRNGYHGNRNHRLRRSYYWSYKHLLRRRNLRTDVENILNNTLSKTLANLYMTNKRLHMLLLNMTPWKGFEIISKDTCATVLFIINVIWRCKILTTSSRFHAPWMKSFFICSRTSIWASRHSVACTVLIGVTCYLKIMFGRVSSAVTNISTTIIYTRIFSVADLSLNQIGK